MHDAPADLHGEHINGCSPDAGHGLAIVQDILLPHVLLDRLQKQREIQGYLLQGHSRLLQDLIEAYQ